MSDLIVQIEGLKVTYETEAAGFRAVDGVDLTMSAGEIVALVGESGSGKSSVALGLMGLLSRRQATVSGQVHFEGQDLLSLPPKRLRRMLGAKIGIIFQEAGSSLDPLFSCGRQISEVIRAHLSLPAEEVRQRVLALLEMTGVVPAERIYNEFPHELSGGLKQRVCIAMALCCDPSVLIADEPTSAVDVVTAQRVLSLLGALREKMLLAILLITHDLTIVENVADRILVMYCGRIVEEAPARELFTRPLHPYTRGLLDSRPLLLKKLKRLPVIRGSIPSPSRVPEGCHFHPRCSLAEERCRLGESPMLSLEGGRCVRCWKVNSFG